MAHAQNRRTPETRPTVRRLLAELRADERGAIFSEYVILTGLVAIVSIPAFLFAGAAVAHSFVFVRGYMLYPFP